MINGFKFSFNTLVKSILLLSFIFEIYEGKCQLLSHIRSIARTDFESKTYDASIIISCVEEGNKMRYLSGNETDVSVSNSIDSTASASVGNDQESSVVSESSSLSATEDTNSTSTASSSQSVVSDLEKENNIVMEQSSSNTTSNSEINSEIEGSQDSESNVVSDDKSEISSSDSSQIQSQDNAQVNINNENSSISSIESTEESQQQIQSEIPSSIVTEETSFSSISAENSTTIEVVDNKSQIEIVESSSEQQEQHSDISSSESSPIENTNNDVVKLQEPIETNEQTESSSSIINNEVTSTDSSVDNTNLTTIQNTESSSSTSEEIMSASEHKEIEYSKSQIICTATSNNTQIKILNHIKTYTNTNLQDEYLIKQIKEDDEIFYSCEIKSASGEVEKLENSFKLSKSNKLNISTVGNLPSEDNILIKYNNSEIKKGNKPDLFLYLGNTNQPLESSLTNKHSRLLKSLNAMSSSSFFMTTPGNQELNDQFKTYKSMYSTYIGSTESNTEDNLYYSLIVKDTYIVSFDSNIKAQEINKDYMTNQISWLINDLKQNKKKAKFSILFTHNSFYCSTGTSDCSSNSKDLKILLADVLNSFDIIISGDSDVFHRTQPVYEEKIDTESYLEKEHKYVNPKYPIYLNCGTGGDNKSSVDISQKSDLFAKRLHTIGICDFEVNSNSLKGRFLNSEGVILDSFELEKKQIEEITKEQETQDSEESEDNNEEDQIPVGDIVNEVDNDLNDFRERNIFVLIVSIFSIYIYILLRNIKIIIGNLRKAGYSHISTSEDSSMEMGNIVSTDDDN